VAVWSCASSAVRPTLPSTRSTASRDPTRVTRRLFLVAGSAGSGKSTLAKALAHELEAGWLHLDSIWLAMKVAAGEGTPAQDVLDIDRRMRRADEADDDVLAVHVAASGEVCRALPAVLGLELQAHERLVADGAWLLPSFVTELELPDTEVRVVYIVQRTEADVEAALIPRRGALPLEDRHRLMNRRIFQYGAWLADEARAYDMPVVEALPFESLLDRARTALLPH
jgi:2-phosphoglycerate kinase